MKKISFILALAALFLFTFAFSGQKALAVDPRLGPSCVAGDSAGFTVGTGIFASQSFKPGFDRISKLTIRMSGHGDMSVGISTSSGSSSGSLYSGTISTSGDYSATYTKTFSAITVDPNTTYYLYATGGGPSNAWSETSAGCYADGRDFIYLDGSPVHDVNEDFVFGIWGYNSTDTDSATTDTTGTTTDNSSVSASIKAPTGGKVEFVDATKSAKISWTKSVTTDIDGYQVYRSEERTKSFAKLGEVTKDKTEYSDTTILASKTYYYYIRAYKGTSESVSSTTLTLATPAFTAAAETAVVSKPKTAVSLAPDESGMGTTFYILTAIAGLLILGLAIYEIIMHSKNKGQNIFQNFKLHRGDRR